MSESDLEALANAKVKEAIQAAIDRIGPKDFASVSGIPQNAMKEILESDDQYVPVKIVSVACQINKSHGDPVLSHSSVSECLKETTVRLPQGPQPRQEAGKKPSPVRPVRTRAPIGPMYDQKSLKLLNFGVNTITLLLICYFLGGILLAPLLNLQACVGLTFSPLAASPCLGSVIGLIAGAFGSLGYTYYYFTRKL